MPAKKGISFQLCAESPSPLDQTPPIFSATLTDTCVGAHLLGKETGVSLLGLTRAMGQVVPGLLSNHVPLALLRACTRPALSVWGCNSSPTGVWGCNSSPTGCLVLRILMAG